MWYRRNFKSRVLRHCMKITVQIMITFWPKIWQRQKWSTKFWKHVAYNCWCYNQPETEVQRTTHFVYRGLMVSMCGSERISNIDYITWFSLSSEQTGSVILLVMCIVTTICTHQHNIKSVHIFYHYDCPYLHFTVYF